MNTTMNGSSCSISLNPTARRIGETFAYCLIFVVSLVGNSFIGIIVYKTRTLRKPVNYFIVNMAISDLLFPIFVFPAQLTLLYVDSQWLIGGPLGQALCKLVEFLENVSSFVSIQSLVLIAVDRFGAVLFPLRSPFISSKLCSVFILATWIIAMAVFSPYLFFRKLVEYADGKLFCKIRWNEAFGDSSSKEDYFLAICVVCFYIPIALLVILYSIIVIKLRSQKIPGEHSVIAEQERVRRNRNVVKMSIAIVVGFVLCWVPLTIGILLLLFARDSVPCSFLLCDRIALFLAYSNCAINPCICFSFSSNFRQGLKKRLKLVDEADDV